VVEVLSIEDRTPVFLRAIPTDEAAEAGWNYRCELDSALIATSGTEIRIKFRAHGSSSTVFSGVSIGPRLGATEDFDDAPTRITFNSGSSSVTLVKKQEIWSDWVWYDLDKSIDHLIHVFQDSSHFFKSKSYTGQTYRKETFDDDTLVENISGYASWGKHVHFMEIEIRGAWTTTTTATYPPEAFVYQDAVEVLSRQTTTTTTVTTTSTTGPPLPTTTTTTSTTAPPITSTTTTAPPLPTTTTTSTSTTVPQPTTTTTVPPVTSTTAPPVTTSTTAPPLVTTTTTVQPITTTTSTSTTAPPFTTTTSTTVTTTTIGGTVCWGQDTGVEEDHFLDFTDKWEGDAVTIGTGDAEKLGFTTGRYKQLKNPWYYGTKRAQIKLNKYNIGENVTIFYKTGSTIGGLSSQDWKRYRGVFKSLGFINVKLFEE
jgi:hypothetical protein